MKKLMTALLTVLTVMAANAKTLIVYYSFTNNVHIIAADLQQQTGADVLRIEPAEEGLDYAADNYALGSALIAAIRNNPDDASSYPDIKPVNVSLDAYDIVIVAAPLWWGNMAAPLQTFLFHHGAEMAGKKIGLIVSSASSGISAVEADAHRLIPDGDFLDPSLWIRSSQTTNCHTMIADWLNEIDYTGLTSGVVPTLNDRPVTITVTNDAIVLSGDFDRFSLYGLSGKKVVETSDCIVGTSGLGAGVYVAHIQANAGIQSNKILLSK